MITKPTLLLDEHRCRRNIQAMADKAKRHELIFRPHFKTHQSLEIGRWFKEYGLSKITVSSVAMADYFSAEWNDITIAFPVNILEIDSINNLAKQIRLNLLVESIDAIQFLASHLKHQVGIFLKIDIGYHRTGIAPSNFQLMDDIIAKASTSPVLDFRGFLAHAGHTYKCRSHTEIQAIHDQGLSYLASIRANYQASYPDLVISLGDTPSCSVVDNFPGIDEIRPGNFVFYDLTQQRISSNRIDQIAVAMACPIVAIHPDREEIIVYGGGVHFSKDRMQDEAEGTIFGRVVKPKGSSWGDLIPAMYVKSLSQEHGIIKVPADKIKSYQIGDHLLILPVHSCMAANAMKSYQTTEGKIVDRL